MVIYKYLSVLLFFVLALSQPRKDYNFFYNNLSKDKDFQVYKSAHVEVLKKVEEWHFDLKGFDPKKLSREDVETEDRFVKALKRQNFKNAEDYARLLFKKRSALLSFYKRNPEFLKLKPEEIKKIFNKHLPSPENFDRLLN